MSEEEEGYGVGWGGGGSIFMCTDGYLLCDLISLPPEEAPTAGLMLASMKSFAQ